jgi:DNA-binding transcriptional MerR regulator
VTANTLTVGQAARRSGLTPKAIRLYEAKGLLSEAPRTESGYRTYTPDDLEVLRFVRQAKVLGLSLQEIKDIIDLQRAGSQPCGKALALLDLHIHEIDRKLRELRSLRSRLIRARDEVGDLSRSGADAAVCRIIESQELAS